MKVLIQWATATAQDWYEYDIRNNGDARSLFKKKKPLGNDVIDDEPGWISAVNIQGVVFEGVDHVALEYFNGFLLVHSWIDDDKDTPADEFFAQRWEFRDPAPDPRIDGRMNTRQHCTWYGAPNSLVAANVHGAKSYDEFVRPDEAQTLHGVWLTDNLFAEHQSKRTLRGWRDWI